MVIDDELCRIFYFILYIDWLKDKECGIGVMSWKYYDIIKDENVLYVEFVKFFDGDLYKVKKIYLGRWLIK